MKQFIFLCSLLLALNTPLFSNPSEETPDSLKAWKFHTNYMLTFSQVSYKYWASGGDNAISGISNLKFNLKYQKNKTIWLNQFEFGYGLMQQQEKKLIKTEDKIDLNSNYTYKASTYWSYSILANLKTQFTKGYKKPEDTIHISNFMAPGYLITSAGMEYKRDFYSFLFSIMTGKTTFVCDDYLSMLGSYGLKANQKVKIGAGSYVRFEAKKDIVTNVNLNTKLELFSEYMNNPEYVDVNWEVIVRMKINKFLSALINTNLVYDHDVLIDIKDSTGQVIEKAPKVQFKETFGLGLTLSF